MIPNKVNEYPTLPYTPSVAFSSPMKTIYTFIVNTFTPSHTLSLSLVPRLQLV